MADAQQGTQRSDTSAVRVPPANYEAEQGLLGAILCNNKSYHRVSEFLRPEHFADPVHGRIYEACGRLIEKGQQADALRLKLLFDADKALEDVRGAQYLIRLQAAVVTVISAKDYAETIHDLWLRRALITEGELMVHHALNLDRDRIEGLETGVEALKELTGASLLETVERRLAELARQAAGSRDRSALIGEIVARFSAQVSAAHRTDRSALGVTTGIQALDRALGPLVAGDFVVIAGRPSQGKTGLAVNIAEHVALRALQDPAAQCRAVAMFSLEMSSEQIVARIIADRTGISTGRQTGGQMTNDEWDRFLAASDEVARLPLVIDDEARVTMAQIRARARRAVRQRKAGLIIVDYLQLIRGDNRARRDGNRVQELTDITGDLKALGKELEVPVIALSQLSRALEDRDDRRPQLRDLRDSGSIEQDADKVLFVHREAYYLEREKPQKRSGESDQKFSARVEEHAQRLDQHKGRAELIVGKHRTGKAPQTVHVAFDERTIRFSDLDRQDDEQNELPMGDER